MKERITELCHMRFRQRGIRNYSMDELASELGISKKTIYQCFPQKKDIVAEVLNYKIHKDEEHIRNFLGEYAHPIDFLIQVFEHIQDDLATVNPIMFDEIRKYYPSAYRIIDEFHSDFIQDTMIQQVLKGMEMKLFRANLDPLIVSRIKQHMMSQLISVYFELNGRYSLQEIQIQEMYMSLYGMCTAAGATYLNEKLGLVDNSSSEFNTPQVTS